MEYLFVYGTLRQQVAHPLHTFLVYSADFIGLGYVQAKLYVVEHYPGAVLTDDPTSRVLGEVYLLRRPEKVLNKLDAYEGCTRDYPQPHEYKRKKVSVKLENGPNITAWMYEYNLPTKNLKLIPSGDYLDFIKPETQ
jgi:gamma-glutamylcyclotransferase (GGCT)/AIG2-like uncharacterized protein YtfP